MKKIIAMIIAVMLIASLTATMFADAATTGSITINGVKEATTYEVYKLLDLESYNVNSNKYSYKTNANWEDFFATAEAQAYMAVDTDGYATWNTDENDSTKANFAKLALAYAKENDIAPVKSSKNEGEFVITENSGKFSDLELGYYLIDSSMGALCGLTTTNPDASIDAKNGIPTIELHVKEDSNGQWEKSNTADIKQVVEYRVTINAEKGAEKYVLHNTLEDSIDYTTVTKIERVTANGEPTEINASLYEITTSVEDECAFEVAFAKELCDTLTEEDQIMVYYKGVLKTNAAIYEDGNDANAVLTFGDDGVSNEDTVATYTFAVDIIKTDATDKLLNGAQFKIYDAITGGNEVKVVANDENSYRRAGDDEQGVEIIVTDGQMRVIGLDNGIYYLEETVSPEGYNKLSGRQAFEISDGNLYAVFNEGVYSPDTGVQVVNKTGAMLPETGGLGTVLFTLFGGIAVLAIGVVLVTKKRMSNIVD